MVTDSQRRRSTRLKSEGGSERRDRRWAITNLLAQTLTFFKQLLVRRIAGKRPGIRPPACASAPNIHFCKSGNTATVTVPDIAPRRAAAGRAARSAGRRRYLSL